MARLEQITKPLGETMKTKVIAFRVTEQEYEGVVLASKARLMTLGEYVRNQLIMRQYVELSEKERKRVERAAKRDAKKAEANVID